MRKVCLKENELNYNLQLVHNFTLTQNLSPQYCHQFMAGGIGCGTSYICSELLNKIKVQARYSSHGYSTGTNLSILLRNTHYSIAVHNEKTLTLILIMYAAKLPVYYTIWTDTSCRNYVFHCFLPPKIVALTLFCIYKDFYCMYAKIHLAFRSIPPIHNYI